MAAPHIATEPEDFAPAVLMPGDPRRTQHIAELLMDDVRLITDVRKMLNFIEAVNGRPLNVMDPGMGQPSFMIYTIKLFSQFGVERIIRVSTASTLSPKIKVSDVIVATGVHIGSFMNQLCIPSVNFSVAADLRLASTAYQILQLEGAQAGGAVHLGTIMSRDHFCFTLQGQTEALTSYETLRMEMETVALYGVAVECDKQALAILTVSGHLSDHSSDISTTEHETRFADSLCPVAATVHS